MDENKKREGLGVSVRRQLIRPSTGDVWTVGAPSDQPFALSRHGQSCAKIKTQPMFGYRDCRGRPSQISSSDVFGKERTWPYEIYRQPSLIALSAIAPKFAVAAIVMRQSCGRSKLDHTCPLLVY
jgi:hypothetical protein